MRVIKVGGSLLDLPDLAVRLRRWLARQSAARNILLAGGGFQVDAVRKSYQRGEVDDEAAHWQSIQVMRDTARDLSNALHGCVATVDPVQLVNVLRTPLGPQTLVFDAYQFLVHVEGTFPGPPLPHDWTATSDSIAARVAQWLAADELVLLKSTLPTLGTSDSERPARVPSLQADAFVDRHFSIASATIPRVRYVNLRDRQFAEVAFK